MSANNPIQPDDNDYDEELERLSEMKRETSRLDDEALRNEKWNCKVGDLLEVIADMLLYDWPDGPGGKSVSVPMKAEGQIYRVADLKGRGFDLELVSGNGAPEIRAMNSEIPGRYRVLPQP